MRYLLLLVSFFTITSLNAQKDPAAKDLLDLVGKKVKNAKGIQVNLILISKNSKGKAMGPTQTISLKMKGEKYLLDQAKMLILCDGVNIYNYDRANTITKTSVKEAADQTLSPQKLLSGNYGNDFNFKLLSQNKNNAVIELTPTNKLKNFQKVTLVLDKIKTALSSATILDKSNNITDVKVVSINYEATLDDKLFQFNKVNYKNAEIID
jgi:outer membrane lipoprotein-sorting protein